MIKLTSILEYLKTIGFTLLAAFLLVCLSLVAIQYSVYHSYANPPAVAEDKDDPNTVNYYLIGVLIDKNKYLESQNPKNHKINLKLGMLYEIKMDYKSAIQEYKKSIAKAPYNDFVPTYKLACLYTKLDELDEAEDLAHNYQESPNKKNIAMKEDIYKKLGDKYYNLGDYETAADKYEKAMTYENVIKNKKETKYLKESLTASYVYLSEECLKALHQDDAVEYMEMANSILNEPILKYKLAILLMDTEPDRAYRLLDEVFAKEPSIINYNKYYNFLMGMAKDSDEAGNSAQSELYKYKIKKLKEYAQSNILSVNDLQIESALGKIRLNYWRTKYKISLEFQLRNTSNYNMDSLYLDVVFKDGKETIGDYYKQIITSNNILDAWTETPPIVIDMAKERTGKDISPKKITVEVYAAKTEEAYKILLGTFEVEEQPRKKEMNRYVKKFLMIFQKFYSKLPAFMF